MLKGIGCSLDVVDDNLARAKHGLCKRENVITGIVAAAFLVIAGLIYYFDAPFRALESRMSVWNRRLSLARSQQVPFKTFLKEYNGKEGTSISLITITDNKSEKYLLEDGLVVHTYGGPGHVSVKVDVDSQGHIKDYQAYENVQIATL